MRGNLFKGIAIVFIIFVCFIFVFFIIKIKVGNKQIIDFSNTYDKCIIYIGNEKLVLEIKSWKDYEGEQVQIVDKDGNTYLISMDNAILIKEK